MSLYTLTLERSAADRCLLVLRRGEVEAESAETVCHLGSLAAQDLEQIRWYWEDFLDRPGEESRRRAREVEERIRQLGSNLFEALFSAPQARRVWDAAPRDLADLRIEICEDEADPRQPPWELLWDAERRVWPAAACSAFVRRPVTRVTEPGPPGHRPLRVLAVLSPPDRTGRSAFRSAYRRLLEMQTASTGDVEWSLLRPPTVARLSAALLEAEAMGRPFHVVHFEGSGVFLEAPSRRPTPRGLADASFPAEEGRPAGPSGYLLLDHAQDSSRLRLVSALDLADLLGEARTPALSLTASCERPTGEELAALPLDAPAAFASIAAELAAVSSITVFQVPYRLDPDTVAKLYADLYGAVAEGVSPGSAAGAVRAQAAGRPVSHDRLRAHRAPLRAGAAGSRSVPDADHRGLAKRIPDRPRRRRRGDLAAGRHGGRLAAPGAASRRRLRPGRADDRPGPAVHRRLVCVAVRGCGDGQDRRGRRVCALAARQRRARRTGDLHLDRGGRLGRRPARTAHRDLRRCVAQQRISGGSAWTSPSGSTSRSSC